MEPSSNFNRSVPLGRLISTALLVLVIGACDGASAPPEPAAPAKTARSVEPAHRGPRALTAGDLQGFERVTGGALAEQRLPLVVALHGLGDSPRSFLSLFDGLSLPARVVALQAPDPWGSGYSWFAFRASAPDDELAPGIARSAERVAKAIAALERERPTRGRPIVTGFSQGGMLSFAVATAHPERIAAAFPVGGMLPDSLLDKVEQRASAPKVVALHGGSDPLIPPAPTERSVGLLAQRGYDARFESYPGVGHSISPPMAKRLHALIRQAAAP